MKESFFCGHCRSAICTECRQIAEEYAELHTLQKAYLHKREQELVVARREIEILKRARDDYKRILEMGVGPQISAWMDSLTPASLRKAIEAQS